jgi:hypothetical protein
MASTVAEMLMALVMVPVPGAEAAELAALAAGCASAGKQAAARQAAVAVTMRCFMRVGFMQVSRWCIRLK